MVDGRVRVLNFSISGREVTFDEMETGGVFGGLAALDGQPRSAGVVSLTDTLVASVSPDTFMNMLRDHPDMAISMMQELAKIVWSKEFLEAGKRRLAGDTARAASTGEVTALRREARELKLLPSRPCNCVFLKKV